MRFLADESCDFGVVYALRKNGFDVKAIGEFAARSNDSDVMKLAHRERRILLTEDKDFGWLVFVAHEKSAGVILMRFSGNARGSLIKSVLAVVDEHAKKLKRAFVVIEPGYVRVNRNPI